MKPATAVTQTTAPLDAHALRAEFPIFARLIEGHPISYLDSAATAQKPRRVLDAMDAIYTHSYANVHRGVYPLAAEATEIYEAVRPVAQRFVNARSEREIVFTRNATEAINLVAYTWGRQNVGPGDVIVATELEHHSNLVPWQVLAETTGATLRFLRIDDHGELELDALDEIAGLGPVKLVAVGELSNALGTVNPVPELTAWAHAQGAVIIVDAAQSAPHRAIDVQALDVDFLAWSGHKLCGPTGAGGLYGRESLLQAMPPFLTGGDMIRSVRLERTAWNDLPWKFEAGTPAFVEVIGMGEAMRFLLEVGLDRIHAHEVAITAYALERLAEVDGITIHGPLDPAHRGGVISFSLDYAHPHDIAEILGRRGVCVRAGHHCAQPVMERLGVPATTRASFYLYTVPEEVDRLVQGLDVVRGILA